MFLVISCKVDSISRVDLCTRYESNTWRSNCALTRGLVVKLTLDSDLLYQWRINNIGGFVLTSQVLELDRKCILMEWPLDERRLLRSRCVGLKVCTGSRASLPPDSRKPVLRVPGRVCAARGGKAVLVVFKTTRCAPYRFTSIGPPRFITDVVR